MKRHWVGVCHRRPTKKRKAILQSREWRAVHDAQRNGVVRKRIANERGVRRAHRPLRGGVVNGVFQNRAAQRIGAEGAVGEHARLIENALAHL